jgi:hypothetical protein
MPFVGLVTAPPMQTPRLVAAHSARFASRSRNRRSEFVVQRPDLRVGR